ncbi:MAG: nuclear transport factor 2 family protein [Xanthomonadaceae bacterium]|nr:nuclear transport factor 2 family protein [Xanthomonadaceae bacterium]
MSASNAETIHRLYVALGQRDGEAMAACYTPDATFEDPAFSLRGEAVGDMWRMLCTRGKDLTVEASGIDADASTGRARWVATYTFSGSGRKVVNRIDARFTFRDGLIATHVDTFDLWRWASQALGPVGLLLGWTPFLRAKIRAQAAQSLAKFSADRRARLS